MPNDTSDLMGKVYDFFSGIYATASTRQAFLAFEPLGLPMPGESFKDNATDTAFDPALAIYLLSDLANSAASVNSSSLIRGNQKLETFMKLFMESSMPVDATAAQSLGAAKLDASPAFDQTLPVPGPIPSRFYPVYASPASWYDPSVNDNWASQSFSNLQTTQAPGPPPASPPPPRPVPIGPLIWRVVAPPLRPTLVTAVQEQNRAPVRIAAVTSSFRPLSVAAASSAIRVSAQPAANPGQPGVAFNMHASAAMFRSSAQWAAINANNQPQPVATNGISISFDHCVGTFNRPWFPATLLLLRDWFVPGYSSGEISNGSGAGDPGLMPVVTTGFVAVRNLKISAQWSASDLQAIPGSASFGPFSLVGRSFESSSGTLTCPGIQIIGWFCSAFPVLPPVSDPGLAPPAPPADPTSIPGTAQGGA